jgi:hypothetical protein
MIRGEMGDVKGIEGASMNAAVETTPALGELTVANAFLGDRRALDEAWERDGYWYFRDVLDQEALTRLRTVYLDLLKSLGVIDRNATEAVYNGASLANYPPEYGSVGRDARLAALCEPPGRSRLLPPGTGG